MRYFYECGICGHVHPCCFAGDCRDDTNRFTVAEIEAQYGDRATIVEMDEADDFPSDDSIVPDIDPRSEESLPEYPERAD